MAAHQAPPSLGFSRQEDWSRLPFPSPMHESEKWKWSHSVVSDCWRPHGLQPTRLLRPWDFPGRSTGVGCHCLLLEKYFFSEIDIYWTYGIIPKPAAFGSSTAHYPRTHSVWFMNMKYHRIMPQLKWLPLWEKNHNNGQTAMKSIHIPYQPVSVCLCTPIKCPSTCTTSVSISIRPQVVHLL